MFDSAAEAWYSSAFGILAVVTCICWLCFARLTMARIEREMKRDGLSRSSSWDGVGLRVLWYLYAIVLPVGDWNRADDPMIDVPTVRRYATRFDRILGMIFFVAGNTWVIVIVLGEIFFKID
jgi:hypothetical protein